MLLLSFKLFTIQTVLKDSPEQKLLQILGRIQKSVLKKKNSPFPQPLEATLVPLGILPGMFCS